MKQFNLVDFLRKFYGITNNTLIVNEVSHKDILKLFPFIRTCQYKDINTEDLLKGNIIGVYDKNNTVLYYYNPRLMIDFNNTDLTLKKEEKNIKFSISDISMLSKDELLKLRKKYRLLGLRKDANKLTKLIHKKKLDEPKLYKEKKEKIKIKESYYD